MIKKNRIARGVRVLLNNEFKEKCLGDKYLMEEPVIFIADEHVYNDSVGDYVFIKGGSLINSGTAYLTQLNLFFEVPERPLYDLYNRDETKPVETVTVAELIEELQHVEDKNKPAFVYGNDQRFAISKGCSVDDDLGDRVDINFMPEEV